MGKYFGTDGIRGKNEIFTKDFITIIADSLIKTLKKDNPLILVGGDTRESTKDISLILTEELSLRGARVLDAGIIPTPAVSFLTAHYACDCSIVITASHNPYTDNGIKILNNLGEKFNDNFINEIEEYIDNYLLLDNKISNGCIENIHEDALNIYLDHLLSCINTDLSDLKIGIDTANGATSVIAEKLFKSLNANFEIINNNSSYNTIINKDCGSTHLEAIKQLIIEKKLDFGVSYDGDGDRCLMVTSTGEEIDGDHILGILTNNDQEQKKLVVTVMANQGLINYAENNNLELIITNVGDTLVYEAMKENEVDFGGEQSGHIIMRNKKMHTGDGLLTSIVIAEIIKNTNKSLKDLSSVVPKLPQVIVNLQAEANAKEKYKTSVDVTEIINKYESILREEHGRLNVRPSGTEPLIRITMWGESKEKIENLANELAKEIERIIN